jgi:hypothetical protein
VRARRDFFANGQARVNVNRLSRGEPGRRVQLILADAVQEGARIEVETEALEESAFFYQITTSWTKSPPTAYFHAQWRRVRLH